MKPIFYYLFSVAVLSAIGVYQHYYSMHREEAYIEIAQDVRRNANSFNEISKDLIDFEINNLIESNGDSLLYIKNIMLEIDSVATLHNRAISELYNKYNIEYLNNADVYIEVSESMSMREASVLQTAHDSLCYRLREICKTYDARKMGLQVQSDSLYERHFAQTNLPLSQLSFIKQCAWIANEQQYFAYLQYRLYRNILDFIQPERDRQVTYKILANDLGEPLSLKKHKEFYFYCAPQPIVERIKHNRIEYNVAGKILSTAEGKVWYESQTEIRPNDITATLHDSIVKSKHKYYD